MLKLISLIALLFIKTAATSTLPDEQVVLAKCYENLNRYMSKVSSISGDSIPQLKSSRPLECIVSYKDECSAAYATNKVYLGVGGEKCLAPYDNLSLVYHEATHWLSRQLSRTVIDNILDEALADMVQSVLLNSSIFADGFNSTRIVSYLRDSDTVLKYPNDFYGDAHTSSLIFSSVVWRFFELVKMNYTLEESQRILLRTILYYMRNYDLNNSFGSFGHSFLESFLTLYPKSELFWGLQTYLQEAGLLEGMLNFKVEDFFSPVSVIEGQWYIGEIPLSLYSERNVLCGALDPEAVLIFKNTHGEAIYHSKLKTLKESEAKKIAQKVELVPVGAVLNNNSHTVINLGAVKSDDELIRYVVVNSPYLHPDDLEIGFVHAGVTTPLQKGRGQIPLAGMFVPYKEGNIIVNQYGRGIESLITSLSVYTLSLSQCVANFTSD